MKSRTLFFLSFALCAGLVSASEQGYKLGKAKQAPKELASEIADALNPEGYQVQGSDGTMAEIWLLKELEMKPGFSPNFNVKYPFTTGQLIGALRVPKDAGFSDFRGQEIPAGVYTLRYAQQPMDGNHLGTAETSDFLLVLPADADKSTMLIRFAKQLQETSMKATGTEHPGVFWMPPPAEEKAKSATLKHDEEKDFWILDTTAKGDEGDIPMRVVVVGQSDV